MAGYHRYYRVNPRGFANEYTIYVMPGCGPHDQLMARFPNAEQITRSEAIEYGIRKPNWAKRNDQQWFGGLAWTADSEYQADRDFRGEIMTDSDRLGYAAIATADILSGND